ncbi:protein GL2-INTERACTING REPRESSOR 1-like [Malania oleifera]|uniref:protein GL2-INTERACTING REPRESSOR 1-like n=1 Tax=Malania oleifera TaxID=397392 RepID=UPI0025AE4226|nr:protein GL2-INTERACTING REPRESSOR 1-like [Malania oleifera]XP_057978872.1 protein GL2-INTERACTING REPRESSOR 1-like [Malania oleifera]XP_057978873.1 protein GL2-INTERACTING REPRESSOR 1-like [Malania oleifera]
MDKMLAEEFQDDFPMEIEINPTGEKSSNLDLNLKLSPPKENKSADESMMKMMMMLTSSSSSSYSGSSPSSSPLPSSSGSSCTSLDPNPYEAFLNFNDQPEEASLVLMGCPHCLLYVMVSEIDPKCPKCKSPALMDFFRGNAY